MIFMVPGMDRMRGQLHGPAGAPADQNTQPRSHVRSAVLGFKQISLEIALVETDKPFEGLTK